MRRRRVLRAVPAIGVNIQAPVAGLKSRRDMRLISLILIAAAVFLLFLANAARFLVIDQPRPSDVILVVAGETAYRPARALDLLRRGFGRRLILDVPANADLFGTSELDLAQRYVESLPEAGSIKICPIYGLSTKAEAHDAGRCLSNSAAENILLVTSDYHTRRALSIFKKELPKHDYSIAAAYDPQQFGVHWWRHREWAKTFLYESLRLGWWELIDRWH